MKPNLYKEELIDLSTDTNFEKLASFAVENLLSPEEMDIDLGELIEKQAYAEDAVFADDINRMFSIATPVETKISALYATKCASMLPEEVVNRINNACSIYGIDIEIPVVNKVASVMDDPEIMAAIDAFEKDWVDTEAETTEKYAHATEYGTEFDTCMAARAYHASEPEEIEAIETIAKTASAVPPERMVEILHDLDEQLGFDTPAMQRLVGTPEYAVFEKRASENMVNLGNVSAPLSVISEYQDSIKDLGVDLDWDGESPDSLQLQIERLPSQVKNEIGSWVK